MIRLLVIFGLLFGQQEKTSADDIAGTYVRRVQRHSNIRQFGRTLVLNCDSTVEASFQGDMMNERVKGRWVVRGDTLKVTIDSTYSVRPYGHWNKENCFLIKKNKLILLITELNGKRIEDEKLQEALYKQSKSYAFRMTKKAGCD